MQNEPKNQGFDEEGRQEWVRHPIYPFNPSFIRWNGKILTVMEILSLLGESDIGPTMVMTSEAMIRSACIYKCNGGSFVKQTIAYGSVGEGKETGIYFSITDLTNSGYKEIVVAGKDGLYVFFNNGSD